MTATTFAQSGKQAVTNHQISNQQQSKNQNTMDIIKINLDDYKKSNWSAEELNNAVLVTDFVQNIMNNHDFDYIKTTFGSGSYKQHNRTMTDGISGVVAAVESTVKRYPDFSYDVKNIYVDGNYITFHSHATLKKKHRGDDTKGLNISDTWKVENGKIVEHWDSVEPIDFSARLFVLFNGGKVRNSNGVF